MRNRTLFSIILFIVVVAYGISYGYYYFIVVGSRIKKIKKLSNELYFICIKLVREIDSKTELGISLEKEIKKETLLKLIHVIETASK